MFPDNTVGLIYACHVLEYFDRVEVTDVLREWRRVLAPGGTLRVAVPDFAALVRVYQTHGQLDRLVGPLYGRIAVNTPQGPAVAYHHTTYDYDSLRLVLEGAAFENVRRYDWRATEHSHVDDFSPQPRRRLLAGVRSPYGQGSRAVDQSERGSRQASRSRRLRLATPAVSGWLARWTPPATGPVPAAPARPAR